jgi:PAS domain S-box-containing protein
MPFVAAAGGGIVQQRERDVRTRGVNTLGQVLGDVLVEALRNSPDGAFVTDAAGRIVLWNVAAESILGYSEDETLGRPLAAVLHADASNGHASASPPAAGAKATPGFDMFARAKAGVGVWISVSVLALLDRRTGASVVVHLFRDVTSHREHLTVATNGTETAGTAPLTRRECEVLHLMGDGLNTAAMARRLHLSRATIRNHVQNILLKLDVHSRLEAVALGRRCRLL